MVTVPDEVDPAAPARGSCGSKSRDGGSGSVGERVSRPMAGPRTPTDHQGGRAGQRNSTRNAEHFACARTGPRRVSILNVICVIFSKTGSRCQSERWATCPPVTGLAGQPAARRPGSNGDAGLKRPVSVAFDWHPAESRAARPSCDSLNDRARQPFMVDDTGVPGPGPGTRH